MTICSFIAFGCGGDDDGDSDGGTDATLDFGPEDSGGGTDTNAMDTSGTDTNEPPGECLPGGDPCTAARGCASRGAECLEERVSVTGMAPDGIEGLPGGDTSFSTTIWTDGVCVEQGLPTAVGPFACDREDAASCGDCQTCLEFDTQGFCLPSCEANVTDNDVCRDTYACGRGDNNGAVVCVPGCTGDLECNVRRVETNGIPGIQSQLDCEDEPADCDGSMTNFDRLQYDSESPNAVCNMDSYQCDDPDRSDTAMGGDNCTSDEMCEEGTPGRNGFCIEESTDPDTGFVSWRGGACTKVDCDVPGNECAGDAVCQERGLGIALCLSGCTVGEGADAEDPATWLDAATADGGCGEGYGCFWGGVGGFGVENNGACVATEFSDAVTEANTGAPCASNADCYSPFGNALCIEEWGGDTGYCTQNDPGAPRFAPDSDINICGEGASIVAGFGGDPLFTLCLQECETGNDCVNGRDAANADVGCIPLTMDAETSHCFAAACDLEDASTCADTHECVMVGEFAECQLR